MAGPAPRVWLAAACCLMCLWLAGCSSGGEDGEGGGLNPKKAEEVTRNIKDMVQMLGASARESLERPAMGGPRPPQLAVVPLAEGDKHRLSPSGLIEYLLRASMNPPPTFELTGRAEFFAVFRDLDRTWQSRDLVFAWYHGTPPRPYCRPVVRRVQAMEGNPWPVAVYGCWSEPSGLGNFSNSLGLRSVMRRSDWDDSRCYGPRLIRIFDLAGFYQEPDGTQVPLPGSHLIAEARLDIMPTGVQITP